MIAAAFVVWLYQNDFAMFRGLTKRNRAGRRATCSSSDKYYLDDLYENVIVYGIKKPIATACNWFNQQVIDAIVNALGIGARKTGNWVYTGPGGVGHRHPQHLVGGQQPPQFLLQPGPVVRAQHPRRPAGCAAGRSRPTRSPTVRDTAERAGRRGRLR